MVGSHGRNAVAAHSWGRSATRSFNPSGAGDRGSAVVGGGGGGGAALLHRSSRPPRLSGADHDRIRPGYRPFHPSGASQVRTGQNDFTELTKAVDPQIEATGDLAGLIIDAPEFPGWDSFGTMVTHFRFVRDHHKRVKKVAIVTKSPSEMSPSIWPRTLCPPKFDIFPPSGNGLTATPTVSRQVNYDLGRDPRHLKSETRVAISTGGWHQMEVIQ